MIKDLRKFYLFLALAFPLAGCKLSAPTIQPTQEKITLTKVPSKVIVSTSTITPTAIAPTWTPIPTLSSKDAQRMVLELLENNAGCELPCWWGIVPGKTSWQIAQHYLVSFASRLGQGIPSISTDEGGVEHSHLNYAVYFTVTSYPEEVASGYRVTNGIIDQIVVNNHGTELGYQLYRLLLLYGKPDEVLIDVLPNTPAGKPWFTLYIFYTDRGVIAKYNNAAQLNGEKILICPLGLGPEMTLLPPHDLTLDSMEKIAYDFPGKALTSLNDIQGLNIETFYNDMKSPGSCLPVDPSLLK